MRILKNLDEFWKTWKEFEKMSGNPALVFVNVTYTKSSNK